MLYGQQVAAASGETKRGRSDMRRLLPSANGLALLLAMRVLS